MWGLGCDQAKDSDRQGIARLGKLRSPPGLHPPRSLALRSFAEIHSWLLGFNQAAKLWSIWRVKPDYPASENTQGGAGLVRYIVHSLLAEDSAMAATWRTRSWKPFHYSSSRSYYNLNFCSRIPRHTIHAPVEGQCVDDWHTRNPALAYCSH